ncbi:uncharacterized protein si:ch211-13c6.2 isoform X2 [Takifugu flavidus]|uniref:uncharacterized protein si:ch211-13c6.2 isoform X2 n=1 Tax=Takifugu flavidus TaxID=433684 RepID=UPI0025446B88|nr:uncharacterized protein si:ch211-13c6.2 isoform X2 [Takifugu flavidus]
MDEFVTPYDEDDAQFIECKVCEKSMRGETLYKIHLTSPSHLKKEDALIAVGRAVRRQNTPIFEDILHYLDYMKLDEPIIGLDYLRELSNNDSHGDPRYTCNLCNQTAHLTEMVRHLIGRKHRQKYMETKRPDLVTWNKRESLGGNICKAKAEMIERQDGRGHPVMAKRSRNTTFPSPGDQRWQMENRYKKGSLARQGATLHLPSLMDFKIDCVPRGGSVSKQPNESSFHQEDSYGLEQDCRDTSSWGRFEENVQITIKTDHRERDGCKQAHGDPHYRTNYKEQYGRAEQRAVELKPNISNCYSRLEVRLGRSQSYSRDGSCVEEATYRRGYPETDPLDIVRTEEKGIEHGRSSVYKQLYPNDDSRQWSWDRRRGSREPESRRRSFSRGVESDQSRDFLVNAQLMEDHNIGKPYTEAAKPGLSRPGLSNLERKGDVPRFMADIPEPFKRFLKGRSDDIEQGKRKRKSRFSDASIEEVAKTRRMYEECGPSELKYDSYHSPDHSSLRPRMNETQHSGHVQSPHHYESYHRAGERGGSQKEVVYDMLKNIEVANREEAEFLKSKLCDLLKEFMAKKSDNIEKTPSRAFVSKNFNSLNPDDCLPTRHMYERMLRENCDYRQQVESPNYHEDHRESVWENLAHNMAEEQHSEHSRSMQAEPRYPSSNHSHHEDGFVQSEIPSRQVFNLSDAPSYPQRALEPTSSYGDEDHLDLHPSAYFQYMEKSGLYSSSLEKITSTLLELVKRQ